MSIARGIVNFFREPYNGRTIAVLVGVFVLVLFNFSQNRGPSEAQRAFEDVVHDVEEPNRNSEAQKDELTLITIQSNAQGRTYNWSLSNEDEKEAPLVTRVLQLLREASLPQLQEVGIDATVPGPAGDEIVIGVTKGPAAGPQRLFVARLTQTEFAQNIQIQNLVKLVEITKN